MKCESPSVARLCELFTYDSESGKLIRRITTSSRAVAGSTPGWIEVRGGHRRLRIEVDGRSFLAHRIVWAIVTGAWPKDDIDHRDGDGLNNRFANLRSATKAINAQNRQRSVRRTVSPGLPLGVDSAPNAGKKRFRAVITANGKKHYLGAHETAEAAHKAYLEAKRRLHEGCTI